MKFPVFAHLLPAKLFAISLLGTTLLTTTLQLGCTGGELTSDAGTDAGTSDGGALVEPGVEVDGGEPDGVTDAGEPEGLVDAGEPDVPGDGGPIVEPTCQGTVISSGATEGNTLDGTSVYQGSCQGEDLPELIYQYTVTEDGKQLHVGVDEGETNGYFTLYARSSCSDAASELACTKIPPGIDFTNPDLGKSFVLYDLSAGDVVTIFVDGDLFFDEVEGVTAVGGAFTLNVREVTDLAIGDACDPLSDDALCGEGQLCGLENVCEVDPCAGIPAEGLCDGDIVVTCVDGIYDAYDCVLDGAGFYPAGTTCEVDPLVGAACHVPEGEFCRSGFGGFLCANDLTCLYEDASSAVAFCADVSLETCEENSCTATNELILGCFGDELALRCPEGTQCGVGGCTGAGEGQFCSQQVSCGAGLVCNDRVCLSEQGQSLYPQFAPSCEFDDAVCGAGEACYDSYCHISCTIGDACTTLTGLAGTCNPIEEDSTEGVCVAASGVFDACGGDVNRECEEGYCLGLGTAAYCIGLCYPGFPPCPGDTVCNEAFICERPNLDGPCGPTADGRQVALCNSGQYCDATGTCVTP